MPQRFPKAETAPAGDAPHRKKRWGGPVAHASPRGTSSGPRKQPRRLLGLERRPARYDLALLRSGLIIEVPKAETAVAALRERLDPQAAGSGPYSSERVSRTSDFSVRGGLPVAWRWSIRAVEHRSGRRVLSLPCRWVWQRLVLWLGEEGSSQGWVGDQAFDEAAADRGPDGWTSGDAIGEADDFGRCA